MIHQKPDSYDRNLVTIIIFHTSLLKTLVYWCNVSHVEFFV